MHFVHSRFNFLQQGFHFAGNKFARFIYGWSNHYCTIIQTDVGKDDQRMLKQKRSEDKVTRRTVHLL